MEDKEITEEHRREVRRSVAHSMAVIQMDLHSHGYSAAETVTEIMSALMSLSAFLFRKFTDRPREAFMHAAGIAYDEGSGAPAPESNGAVPGGGKPTPAGE